MNKMRLWAFIQKNVCSIVALMFIGLLVALPAGAQTREMSLWKYPGSFPFTGSEQEACDLFVEAGELDLSGCETGMELLRQGKCEAYYLRDGELVTTTFTGLDGVSHSKTLGVNFLYPEDHPEAGKSIPADDQKRLVFSCHLNGEDNKALALPYVCGNWTVHTRIRPTSSVEVVCRDVPFDGGNNLMQDEHIHIDSVNQGVQSCSGHNWFIPSLNMHFINEKIKSNGSTRECYPISLMKQEQ